MKIRLIKIFLIIILVPIFLFLLVKEVNAGCTFIDSFADWADLCPGYCSCRVNPMNVGDCDKCVDDYIAWYWCWPGCTGCGCTGGCFVEGTSVATEQLSDQAIENLEPGETVSSFNPETGEISESQVAEVHKLTREGYYELETESGKKVKVTGEHPFLALKSENDQAPNSKLQTLVAQLKNFLSNTLTFRLINNLQTKLNETLE